MLRMNKARRILEPGETAQEPIETDADGQRLVQDPARVTHVLVKGNGPMATAREAEVLKARVQSIYAGFAADHPGTVPDEYAIRILTWRDQNAMMIGAVEKETALVLFLFMMVSMVAVMLVLAIFWSMVAEKTKDIGVLRAIGAGKLGVAWLWVRYGLVIGVVGVVAGASIAYLVVHNINPIHDWMGRAMGIVIWDPRIYYFVRIPNQVETPKAITVMIVFVISCAVGAMVPAGRAANMSPVRALRFE